MAKVMRTKRIQTEDLGLTAQDVQFKCPDGMNAKLLEFREFENAILLSLEFGDGKTYSGCPILATDSFAPVKVELRKKRIIKRKRKNDADGTKKPPKVYYSRENCPQVYVDERNTVKEKLRFGRDRNIPSYRVSGLPVEEKSSSHIEKEDDTTNTFSSNKSCNAEMENYKNEAFPDFNLSDGEDKSFYQSIRINEEDSISEFLSSDNVLEQSLGSRSTSLNITSKENKNSTTSHISTYSQARSQQHNSEQNETPPMMNSIDKKNTTSEESAPFLMELDIKLSPRRKEETDIAKHFFVTKDMALREYPPHLSNTELFVLNTDINTIQPITHNTSQESFALRETPPLLFPEPDSFQTDPEGSDPSIYNADEEACSFRETPPYLSPEPDLVFQSIQNTVQPTINSTDEESSSSRETPPLLFQKSDLVFQTDQNTVQPIINYTYVERSALNKFPSYLCPEKDLVFKPEKNKIRLTTKDNSYSVSSALNASCSSDHWIMI